jgi:hypothetical protein
MNVNWHKSIRKVTDYRLDEQGLIAGRGKDIFLLHHYVQTGSEAHSAFYPMNNGASLPINPGEKWLEHKTDLSLPSTTEVKNV